MHTSNWKHPLAELLFDSQDGETALLKEPYNCIANRWFFKNLMHSCASVQPNTPHKNILDTTGIAIPIPMGYKHRHCSPSSHYVRELGTCERS